MPSALSRRSWTTAWGLHVGRVRVGEADRLQRAEAQGLAAALGHHLDRQAALEVGGVLLPVLELGLVGGEQRVDEGLVLVAVHRAVEVGGALGLGLALVVARLEPGLGEIDGLEVDDRGDGVEEGEGGLVGQGADRLGEGRRGQRAGGDDDARPVGRRQAGDLAAVDGDERVGFEAGGDLGGEGHAVDGERAAGGDGVAVGGGDDEAAGLAHLPVQQADGVLLVVVGAEGVGADQLGEAVGLVGEGADDGAHLVQDHRHAGLGDLPGGLGAGEAAADDVDFAHAHGRGSRPGGGKWEGRRGRSPRWRRPCASASRDRAEMEAPMRLPLPRS